MRDSFFEIEAPHQTDHEDHARRDAEHTIVHLDFAGALQCQVVIEQPYLDGQRGDKSERRDMMRKDEECAHDKFLLKVWLGLKRGATAKRAIVLRHSSHMRAGL